MAEPIEMTSYSFANSVISDELKKYMNALRTAVTEIHISIAIRALSLTLPIFLAPKFCPTNVVTDIPKAP